MAAWPHAFVMLYLFLVGSVVGSFLNVVIHRLPRGGSVVTPRSACPGCGTAIRWFDNVPMLSWVLLRGRCRVCAATISLRYPLVEATAATLAVLTFVRYGLTVAGAEVLVFTWVSLALCFIDLEHQLLPDVLTYPSIVLGLVASYFGGVAVIWESVAGAVVGAALPIAVIFGYKLLRGEEGMGWGDVKYLAAIGAVVGVRDCLWVLVVAAVAGALVGIGLWVSGRGSGKTALPFGTFLAVAVIVWLQLPVAWQEVVRTLTFAIPAR